MRPKKYSTTVPEIADYVADLLDVESDPELCTVLDLAKRHGTPPLHMIAPDVRHLEVLTKAMQPTKIVEIGTLCGYSTVSLARSLAAGGKVYTCEKSEHHAHVANEVFKALQLTEKIELIFGDALVNLPLLSDKGPFDVVFIDANKDHYPEYFDWAIENLRTGGMLIADNVFSFGFIAQDPPPEGKLGELVERMRIFNEKCSKDSRLLSTFFPTGEGLMVGVKL